MNTRMDKSRLNIGAYFLRPYARTEQHVKDVKDCGIDFIVSMESDRPTLDLFAKYGIGAVLCDVLPSWWGGDGNKASGEMHKVHPLEKYVAAAKQFRDHPAVWGVDIGDEPSALDFPYYREVVHTVEKCFPKQFCYLNLYPNYASVAENTSDRVVSQLGTTTYAEHVEEYCKNVPLDYISFDYYVYSTRNVMGFLENLRIVADAARRYGRSLWFIPQVNSNRPVEWTSLNRLRFQAFTSMAFGTDVITWACWTAGWWENQVLDKDGNKTEQYEKLKKVNAEIATLGEVYSKYRCTATHFVGLEANETLQQAPVSELNNGYFMGLRSDSGMPLVVGDMTGRSNDSAKAVFVVAADDYLDEHPTSGRIVFRCDARTVVAYGGEGRVPVCYNEETGEYSVAIRSSEGILITAK